MTAAEDSVRLTQFASGGGCACKIPPGSLEALLNGLGIHSSDERLLVGTESGDDAAVVRVEGDRVIVTTADFFTPVIDDAYDFGRIAAANALSDVYAMGAEPLVAVNLLAWPTEVLPLELAAEVLRGAAAVCDEAGTILGGGHSVVDPEPKFGLAVTGLGDARTIMRNDAATAGLPLTLTKPLGLGVLNNRHKATGDRHEDAVEVMTQLNRDASRAAVAAGCRAATDVTGFGLLGHLFKMVRASGVSAVIDAASVPYLDGVREAVAGGYVPGGSRRNLEWVRPHLTSVVDETDELLLADAQTSGGLLVVGEVPGYPVIGEIVPATDHAVSIT